MDLPRRPPAGSRAGFSLPLSTLALLALVGLSLVWGGWVLVAVLGACGGLVLATWAADLVVPPRGPELPPEEALPPEPPTSPEVLWGTDLASLLDALGALLEQDDLEGLRRRCAEGAEAGAFAWLRERHTAASLRALYAGRRLPGRPGAFKLGGHDRELGHVHVDLASADGERWWLHRVWMCR